MSQKLQIHSSSSPQSPKRVIDALKSTISSARDTTSQTAPTSPIRLSVALNQQLLSPLTTVHFLSSSQTPHLVFPKRETTECSENSRTDLFACNANNNKQQQQQQPVDNYSNEENDLFSQIHKENIADSQKKNSVRNFEVIVTEIKNSKRSKSVKQPSKGNSPLLKISEQSPKVLPTEPVQQTEHDKDIYLAKKRPKNTLERFNKSLGSDMISKLEKKVLKTAIKDLEQDFGINIKCATEGEGPESLLDDALSEKDGLTNERAIRYSKMSEEDAATIFETRRKELLTMLAKLGNSALSKKKFSSKTSTSLAKQNQNNGGQSSEPLKVEVNRERGIRALQDPPSDQTPANRFIVYNNATESSWNNNNPQLGKFATPGKEVNKKSPGFSKFGCDSAPTMQRRNSAKNPREKEDLQASVQRNLEASFNQTFTDHWSESSELKSPTQIVKRAESMLKSREEKADGIESITIDLTKIKSKKKRKTNKRKAAKAAAEEGKIVVMSENSICKQQLVNEDAKLCVAVGKEGKDAKTEGKGASVLLQQITVSSNIKKKNNSVLSQIEELELQIQKMQEETVKVVAVQRGREEKERGKRREEWQRISCMEYDQEGYVNVARMRKSEERTRSLSVKKPMSETLRVPDSTREHLTQVRANLQNNKAVAEGKEGLRNGEKGRMTTSSIGKVSATNTQIASKASKEKEKSTISASTHIRPQDIIAKSPGKEVEKKEKQAINTSQNLKRTSVNNSKTAKSSSQSEASPNTSIFSRSTINTNDIKLKTLDFGRANLKGETSFTLLRGAQTSTNKTSEKERISLLNKVELKQQHIQQSQSRNLNKAYENGHHTLQSVRDVSGATSSTLQKGSIPVGRKTITGIEAETRKNKREAQERCSMANKSLITYKKSITNPLRFKKDRKSPVEDECSGEMSFPDLFDNQVVLSEPSTPFPKVSFSDEIKKILKDGSKPASQPSHPQLKQAKSAEMKSVREIIPKVRKTENNRPTYDGFSSVNLREKVLRDSRLSHESTTLIKLSLATHNLSEMKHEIRPIVLEAIDLQSAKKSSHPRKSQNSGVLQRSDSISTTQGFVPTNYSTSAGGAGSLNSINDLGGPNSQRYVLGNELREKSTNVFVEANNRVQKQQGEGEKNQAPTKEGLTLKRKKMAGYSIC